MTPPASVRDDRPRPAPNAVALQAAALALVAAAIVLVAVTTVSNVQASGIRMGFDFLGDRAGFKISDTVLPFGPDDSNLRAIGVALGNTLFLSFLVCLAATVLGAPLGVARLSDNPLAAGLAAVWVEGVRNTPPVLLLIFLYAFWSQTLPVSEPKEILPGVIATIRGIAVPRLTIDWGPAEVALGLSASLAGYLAMSAAARRRAAAGRWRMATLLVIALGWAAALLWSRDSLALDLPRAEGDDLVGGARLTPEFATVLVGLTLYTAGFIAEIVRSGLGSVPRGQWEAGRALGLTERQVLVRIVAPQMLRVVLPPLTSQYINTIKNSTLAIAVGYSEFMTVMGTVINRTNHALEGTLVIVAVYSAINLALAWLLDLYNRHVQLPVR